MSSGDTQQKPISFPRAVFVGPLAVLSWLLAILLLLIFLPLLLLFGLIGGAGGRRALRRGGAAFLRGFFLGYMPLIRFHVFAELPRRKELLERPACLYAANHRSWLDALLALALFPRVLVPVKAEYTRIPVLGLAMRWMGCLPLDAASPATVLAAVDESRRALAAGESLFVFPEGTRAPGDRLLKFTDVFFRVAVESGVSVVPVLIHSDERYLAPSDERLVPARRPTWHVRLLEQVEPDRRDRAADVGRQVRRRLTAGLAELDERSAP
ncbi:MAG: 1-acyl-sn-glycerol-3-phosphate acyltransferase [Deltaproteobacteria bacterium]|nr:1-acyl-sn-glycerol-3-phosphate acyltransferase [Deltaproteobacteria bacterium]